MLRPLNEGYFFAIGALVLVAGTIAMKGRKPYSDPYQASSEPSTPMGGRSDKIQQLANAIAKQEGFYVPNSLAARARNPGNIKIASMSQPWSDGKAVFGSLDDGWAALRRQLQLIFNNRSQYYELTDTFWKMGYTWSGGDGNWGTNVARFVGTTPDDTLQGWINA